MKFFAKYKKLIGNILLVLFVGIILALSVRGLPGNPTPTDLNTLQWKDNGPFELSPERGRFAFLYSLVEEHSFHLSPSIARFTAPDVGYFNHQYVSIFAPSVSIVTIPGYLIGKYLGAAQFGAFLWMALFALLNVLLIRAIAIRFGAHPLAATLAAITFLFATPAFAYAVTLYEHHLSTFLILLSFYLLIRYNNLVSLVTIWILYAFAFTVDYPNLFLMFPVALAAFLKSGAVSHVRQKLILHVSFLRVLAVISVIIPLSFFLWINKMSYDNPLQLSGSVPAVVSVKQNGSPLLLMDLEKAQLKKTNKKAELPPPDSTFHFFQPRNMLNGFYILLLSPDRGVLMFTPVILFGIAGLVLANKKRQQYLWVMCGIIGFDLLLYSMWGDPYGGWAFGARYLIPAYAVLAIYIALLLTYLQRKKFFLLLFFIILSYSIMVNTLGAVTSNSNPPKIQAEPLSNLTHKKVEYTYMRNANDLNGNVSKSFFFQSYAKQYLSAWEYYSYITMFILITSSFIILYFYTSTKNKYIKGGRHAF